MTHRARYYLDTIKQLEQGSPHYIQMRKDLAELYVKLGRMNDAVGDHPLQPAADGRDAVQEENVCTTPLRSTGVWKSTRGHC